MRSTGLPPGLSLPSVAGRRAPMCPIHHVETGIGYVVREGKPTYTDSLVEGQLRAGLPGLVITRMHPELVHRERGLGNARIVWLAKMPGEGFHNPSDLVGIGKLVQRFIEDQRGTGVVLLDGVEYLIAINGVPQTAALVQQILQYVADAKAVLLVPLDPRSLTSGQWALLTRGLHEIDPERG